MISHDFKRSSFDSCVYFKQCNDESFLYLLLYVDDMLIAAKSKEKIKTVKAQLNNKFEMKDLGVAKKILGMEILRDRVAGRLSLSHKDILKRCFASSIRRMGSLLLFHLQLILDFHLPYVHSQIRRLTTCLKHRILVLWVL